MMHTIGEPFSDVMEPSQQVLATTVYDTLVSDVKPEDLPTKVSRVLGCQYLSPSAEPAFWPVCGKIYEVNKRSMITLPVSLGSTTVNVHFLFGTGAPSTYIAGTVLEALGIQDWQLSDKRPRVNGVKIDLKSSESQWWDKETDMFRDLHFKGINLLGMDFLYAAQATFILNGKDDYCEMSL